MIPLSTMREVRCPHCARLQFKMAGPVALLEGKCRCKTLYTVQGFDVHVQGMAASISTTFDGVRYANFSLTR